MILMYILCNYIYTVDRTTKSDQSAILDAWKPMVKYWDKSIIILNLSTGAGFRNHPLYHVYFLDPKASWVLHPKSFEAQAWEESSRQLSGCASLGWPKEVSKKNMSSSLQIGHRSTFKQQHSSYWWVLSVLDMFCYFLLDMFLSFGMCWTFFLVICMFWCFLFCFWICVWNVVNVCFFFLAFVFVFSE